MSRFLRVCTFLIAVCFTTNLFAAGYTCPTDNSTRTYTSCSANYYMSGCGAESTWTSGKTATPAAGNSCISCPSGYSCSGGTACPTKSSITCSAGTYLPANSSTCTTCAAGYYCPANTYSGKSSSNQGLLDCDTGSATVSSSNVWTSATGSSARTHCYRSVTLNKNNMSGALSLPSNHGCKSISSNSGTTAATVSVYYNTACKLPTTSLSGTATGTNYAGTGSWATSANAASGFVTTITVTDSNAKTYYAGKKYTCSQGYYLKANTNGACTSCATGNYCAGISGKYYSTSDQGLSPCSGLGTGYTSDGGKTATTDKSCYLSVSDGRVRSGTSGTTTTQCAAGTYKAAHKAYYGTSYSCSACSGRTKYSGAGAASCSTVSSGYFSTGCNSSGNNCTGQTQCTNATYCSDGIQYNCNSNYQYNTNAGKTSASQCQTRCSAGYAVLSSNGACTSIQENSYYMGIYTDAHTVSYGGISDLPLCPTSYQDKTTGAAGKSNCINSCDAGTQVESSGADCTTPTGSWYAPAHDVKYGSTSGSNVKSCNSGYATDSKPSSAWHDNANDCKITCSAGTVVESSGAACTTPSGSWYSAQHTVSQGSTSGTNKQSCSSNYATPNTTTQSDHNGSADCTITCPAGKVVNSANAACTTPSGSWYSAQHTVSQGSTSGTNKQSCLSNYATPNTTTQSDHNDSTDCTITCEAGSRVDSAGGDCVAITSGNQYMLKHTVQQGSVSAANQLCPPSYTISGTTQSDHNEKADCKITCSAGYAVLSPDATCSSIQNSTYPGKYTEEHIVSAGYTSSIQTCPAYYQDSVPGVAGKSNCINNCDAGYQVESPGADCTTPSGSWYTPWHSVKYGSTSGSNVKSCNSGYATDSKPSSDWHNNENDCKITCSAGTVVNSSGAACTTPSGSWYSAKHTVSQGSTSGTNKKSCLSNYATPNTTTQSDHNDSTDCTITCTAGSRITAANNTSCTAITSGNEYMQGHTVKQGSVSPANELCPPSYTISGTTQSDHDNKNDCKISCSAGYAVLETDKTCTSIQNSTYKGKWIGANTVSAGNKSSIQTCPAGYQDGATGYSQQSQCAMNVAGGKYVNVANESVASGTCAKGYAKAAHTVTYGKTSSCDACAGATYQDATGQSSCKTCPTVSGASSYGYWNNGKTGDHTVRHGCNATFNNQAISNGTLTTYHCYIDSGADTYGALTNGKGCWVSARSALKCNGGYYNKTYNDDLNTQQDFTYKSAAELKANVCRVVDVGYWSANDSLTRSACSDWRANTSTTGTTSSSTDSCVCVAGRYLNGSNVCTACSAGTYKGSKGNNTCTAAVSGQYVDTTGATSYKLCSALDSSKTDGTYSSVSPYNASTTCRFTQNQQTVPTYCATKTSNTMTYSGTAWPANTYKVTAKGGSIISGNNSASATCSQCEAGKYSAGGTATSCSTCGNWTYSGSGAASCTSCPTVESGYTKLDSTGTGWTTYTKCVEIATASPTNCSSGKLQKVPTASGSTTWATATVNSSNPLNAKPGHYVSGTLCDACGGDNYYCTGGTAGRKTVTTGYYSTGGTSTTRTGQTKCEVGNKCVSGVKELCSGATYQDTTGQSSCKTCPGTYTANTNSGKTAASQCQASCAAGTRVASANSACSSPAGGWFTAQHLVNYGNVSRVNYCMAGYTSTSTSASGHDAKSDCTQTIAGGKYVPSTQISARYIKLTSSGNTANAYVHVVEVQAFASADGTGTNLLSGKSGPTGSKLTNATDGSWDSSSGFAEGSPLIWDLGSVQNLGSLKFAMYPYGRTYNDVTISVSTDNSTYTTVLGPIDVLPQNSTTMVGELVVLSAAPASCAAGKYKASASLALGSTSSCGTCGNWTYSGSGAASCTSCPTVESGYTKLDSTGTGWTTYTKCVEIATASPTNCSSGKLQKVPTASGSTTWATATVNSSNPLNANAGYYVSGTSCAACGGDNYYCTGGTAGRKTVTTGYYSIGTSSTTRSDQKECEEGNKCVSGVKTACSGINEWQDGTGQTTCKTVDDGKYKNGNAALQNCGTGYYCKSGARDQCPNSGTTASATSNAIGQCYKSGMSLTVSNGTGSQRCFYTSGSGTSAVYSTNCDTKTVTGCNGGYYRENTTDLSCKEVGIGYYSANTALNRSACSDWRANTSTTGTTSSSTDSCVCVAGRYLNSSNVCTACSAGTYKGSKGNNTCTSASAGYYVGSTGATGQTACAAGTYTSTTGKSSCTDAAAGTYTTGCQDTTNNKACTGTSVCASNTYSNAKASSCTACDSDYSNSGTAASDHAGVASCKVTCPAGKVVDSANAACTTPSGSWYSKEHTVSQGSTSGTNKQSCLSNYATPNTTTQSDHDNSTDCTITCAAGSRITAANNTSCTAITSGNVYMLGHTVKQGSASDTASSCPSGYTISGTTQSDHDAKSDCKISCSAGNAVLETDKTCTSIQNSTYKGKWIGANTVSAGNKSSIQTCPGYYQDGNGTTAQNQCINSCAAGTQVASANADCSTPQGSTWYTSAHDVKYGSTSGSNVKSCNSGYATANTATQTDHDGASDCKIGCSAGYYVPTAGQGCKVCTAGKYCSAASGIAQTSTTSVTGSVTAGYWNNGCGTNATGGVCSTSYSGGEVNTGCYGSEGATSSCPRNCNELAHSITISGSYSSVSPRSANTACRFTATSKTDSECNSITSNTVSYSGSAWGTNYYTATAKAGSYVTATGKTAAPACEKCNAGTYQDTIGSSAISCTPAEAGYYVGSTGATTQTKCKQGSYTSATGQSACTPCDAGKTNSSDGSISCTATCSNSTGVASNGWETTTWNTNNTVSNLCTIKATAGCSANYYKNSNACATCSSGTNSKYTLSVEGTTTVNDCYLNTTATNYVKNVGEGQTTCAKGSYCPGSVKVYYGGTASSTRLTTGGSELCPAGYRDGATGYSQQSQCTMNVAGGKYVNVENESVASGVCAKGTYKAAHTVTYGKTSSCDACTGATYQDATGQSSCKTCPAATTEVDSGLTYTGTYYYNGSDHSKVTNCYTRLKKSTEKGDIQTYCYANSNGVYGYTYCDGFSGTVCNPGYYYDGTRSYTGFANVIKNVCKSVGEDYYYAGGKISGYTAQTRGQCGSGLTTCGSGLCANEATDCGRQLHYGDKVVHLRSAKRTTPSLNVKIGDTTFYGNLGAVVSNSLRVKNGTTNYSVVNDNQ